MVWVLLVVVAAGQVPDRAGLLEQWKRLAGQIAELYQAGRYREAMEPATEAVRVAERLGESSAQLGFSLHNLADLYRAQENYKQALPLYLRAIAIYEVLGPEHPYTAKALNNLAQVYRAEGSYGQALPLYQRALAIHEKTLGPDHLDTATSLNNLAELYTEQGDYGLALPLYQRALAIREKALGAEHPDTATSLNNLARLYTEQGDYGLALPLCQRALTIREKALGAEHPETAVSLRSLAVLYTAQGDYRQALPLYQRILTIIEKALGPTHPHTAGALNNLAELYREQKDYGQALPLYQRALAIDEKTLGPDHPATATSLKNLARLYTEQGDYGLALPLHQRALAIREKALGPEHPDTAESFNGLAVLYTAQGDYRQALPLYERALAIWEKALGAEHPDTATSLNNLAALYVAQGNYGQALPLYQRALAIDEKTRGPDHPATATPLNNLAELYREQKDYERAQPLYQRALTIREKALGAEHPDTATSLINLALLYATQGDYRQALPLYQRALAIRVKAGADHPVTATLLNNLAELYREQGNYEKALPLFQQALTIREKALGAEHPETAVSLHNLAGLYREQGNYEQALPLYEQALAINEKAIGPEHPLTLTSRSNLALARVAMGTERQQACTGFRDVLHLHRDLTERAVAVSESYFRQHASQAANYIGAALTCGEYLSPSLLLSYHTAMKARAQEETRLLIDAARRRATPEVHAALGRYVAAERRLATSEKTGAPGERIRQLESERADLFQELRAKSAEIREGVLIPSAEQLSKLLEGSALVDLVRYRRPLLKGRWGDAEIGAFVLRKDAPTEWLPLGNAQVLEAKVRQIRIALEDSRKNAAAVRKLGSELYAGLVARIRSAARGVNRIYLVPDGALASVPWAALVDGEGQYLAESDLEIVLLGSSRDLTRLSRSGASRTSDAIFAAPDYGEGTDFDPLPESLEEAEAVKAVSKNGVIFRGADANTKKMAGLAGPRILHIATHGVYEGAAGAAALNRSLLALAGANRGAEGRLTAREMAVLDLQGTQLVVLSVCESARGDWTPADGLLGFQRALTLAGAQSHLLSLWKVDSKATADFMKVYYTKLLVERLGRGSALGQTQREFIRRGRPAAEWAAFALWGNPDPLPQ